MSTMFYLNLFIHLFIYISANYFIHSFILYHRNFIWTHKKKKEGKHNSDHINNNHNTKKSNNNAKSSSKRHREPVLRPPGTDETTNINSYVTHMLAASIGLKLADNTRRILMYTKQKDTNQRFYALCRGLFPIHELCGTMTSLELAKKFVLGVDIPTWRVLLPAIILHGTANFRGKKPIFKWNSSTPWSEMQLSLNMMMMEDHSSLTQILKKSFAKLLWYVLLIRVFGYCVKNYYMIKRKAIKRTTTLAGKQSAVLAELAAAEMLKKQKDKK